MKKIAILGVTGSVGQSACSVARSRGYSVELITANESVAECEALAREFLPKYAVMANEAAARELKVRLSDTEVKVLCGASSIEWAIAECSAETVVNAILGEAGLMPTIATVKAGKRLALANKESLVVAGNIVMPLLCESGSELIPVDSEHSAIFQSLLSGRREEIRRIILTASGGPFRGMCREQLRKVTLEDTLRHPTWKMGRKITTDSATLMNKGFEVIEAAHLFGVSVDNIEVVVHPESILHSAVEYIDKTVIGELSVPDMRTCVQYAVDYPERLYGDFEPLDLFKVGSLTFMKPDTEAFPLLSLAKRAFSDGGAMAAILNAADEVAVGKFLSGKIRFYEISELVHSVYERMTDRKEVNTLEGIISSDREARAIADEYNT